MPVPQTILTRKTKAAIFLVFTIDDGGEEAVRDALEAIPGLNNAVSSRAPEAALAGIVSIGSEAWDRLFAGPRPRSLRPFVPYEGEVHTAPATPADLLVHIKSDDMGLCYELGAKITEALGDAVTVVDEVHGFRYFDLRDLIGFVDGTENPTGQAAIDAITVGDEDPDFAGGSYVAVQRYVHDLSSWNDLSTEEQEAAIGRTKLDNVEMPDDVKPPNSHIALNVVEDENGEEIDVVRDNMPYGDVSGSTVNGPGTNGKGVNGTYYIAYSATPDVTEEMLRKMFIGDPPGTYDRLLDFTTAVTGAQFFTPTLDFIDDLPPAPGGAPVPESARATPSDGSLGIGSLH